MGDEDVRFRFRIWHTGIRLEDGNIMNAVFILLGFPISHIFVPE